MFEIEITYPMPIFKVTEYFINGEKIASVINTLKTEGNVKVITHTTINVLTDKFNKNEFVTI